MFALGSGTTSLLDRKVSSAVLDVGSYYEDSQHDLLFHAQCPSPHRFCAFLALRISHRHVRMTMLRCRARKSSRSRDFHQPLVHFSCPNCMTWPWTPGR